MNKSYNILIVDDDINMIKAIRRILHKYNHNVIYEKNPLNALKIIQDYEIDVLICDHLMPGMTGLHLLELCKKIKPKTIRIMMTGYDDINTIVQGLNSAGIFKYIKKPFNNRDLLNTINTAVEHKIKNDEISEKLNNQKKEQEQYLNELILLETKLKSYSSDMFNSLTNLIKEKDQELYSHCLRVSEYSYSLAEFLNYPYTLREEIKKAALLHDIGKLAIKDSILDKHGALDYEERAKIVQHCQIGYFMLINVCYKTNIPEIVYQHHERIDGNGYPRNLKRNYVLPEANIVSIADVFDAITVDRVYHKRMEFKDALTYIKSLKGSYFYPELVDGFLEVIK